MLVLAIIFLCVSAVFAVLAVIAFAGRGRRILPGYRFRARGKEAVLWERKLLTNVAYLLWTVAVFFSAAGVTVYFLDLKNTLHIAILCVLGAVFAAVAVIWIKYLASGVLKDAAMKAKELSE